MIPMPVINKKWLQAKVLNIYERDIEVMVNEVPFQ